MKKISTIAKIAMSLLCLGASSAAMAQEPTEAQLGVPFTISPNTGFAIVNLGESGTLTATINPGLPAGTETILYKDNNDISDDFFNPEYVPDGPVAMTVVEENNGLITKASWNYLGSYWFLVTNEVIGNQTITLSLEAAGGDSGEVPVLPNGGSLSLDTPATIEAGNYATFMPVSAGKLTAKFNPGIFSFEGGDNLENFLYQSYAGGAGQNPVAQTVETIDGFYVTELSWEVSGFETYYLVVSGWDDQIVTLSMGDDSGNSGSGDSGDDDVEAILKIGVEYMGLSTSNPLEAKFTADANGVLTIVQTGSPDSHLYSDAEHTQEIYPVDYTTSGNTFSLPYALAKGQTVYFYGPTSQYDDLSAVVCSWEASDEDIPVITAGESFQSYNTLMTYTPATDGLLTIQASTYTQGQWWMPSGTGLLFSDMAHTQKVLLTPVDLVDNAPSFYTTPVKANTVYYFYNSIVNNCTFTFTLGELKAPSFVQAEPEPGFAIDATGDYGNGVILTFDPGEIEFDSAVVTYTTVDGVQNETLETDNVGGEGVGWAYNQNGTFKFPGVSYAYSKAVKGSKITLTITGANYNGVAVTGNAYQNNANVSVEDGKVIITWNKPAEDIQLVSSNVPEVVYATSVAGDPAMMATFTFSEKIISQPSASMVFGTQYWGSGSSGDDPDPGCSLPCTVEGATITVDLSGIDFQKVYADGGGTKNYNNITVFVGNIMGEDGQKYLGENPGIAFRPQYDNSAAPAPAFMAAPTFVYDDDPMYPSVILYWNQNVVEVEEGADLTAELTVPNGKEPVKVTLYMTTYDPNADNTPGVADDDTAQPGFPESTPAYNGLILPMTEIISEYGAGEYVLSVGSIVMSESGLVNAPFEKTFTVAALPSETSVEPEINYSGTAITINWDNETVSIYNPYDSEIRIFSADYSDEYTVNPNAVTISNNTVTISLEGLGLEAGDYILSIGDMYFWVGDDNEYSAEISYEFTVATVGINGIEAEMINGGVYNLQGVKVGNSLKGLSNGIYIINGKKVLVRK